MAKYSVMFRVDTRTERAFTKEQIDMAARVFFYRHPPENLTIFSEPNQLKVMWSDNYMDQTKIIRVVGDVEEPDAS